MTQNNLADKAGLTVKTIAKIEAGKTFVSSSSICRLAEALDVTPSLLLQTLDEREETEKIRWKTISEYLESNVKDHNNKKPGK